MNYFWCKFKLGMIEYVVYIYGIDIVCLILVGDKFSDLEVVKFVGLGWVVYVLLG